MTDQTPFPERHLRIVSRIADTLSFVVPTILAFIALWSYIHRDYWRVLFNVGLIAINIGTTTYLQRRTERRRRQFAAELRVLDTLLRRTKDAE
jgi:hypothetical protein